MFLSSKQGHPSTLNKKITLIYQYVVYNSTFIITTIPKLPIKTKIHKYRKCDYFIKSLQNIILPHKFVKVALTCKTKQFLFVLNNQILITWNNCLVSKKTESITTTLLSLIQYIAFQQEPLCFIWSWLFLRYFGS